MQINLPGTVNHRRAAKHCKRCRLPLAGESSHRFLFSQELVRPSQTSPCPLVWEQKGFLFFNCTSAPLCQEGNAGLCSNSISKGSWNEQVGWRVPGLTQFLNPVLAR